MNRNRNRNASPAVKSEIGCRCSQTHSRSTHTLTHTYIQEMDGQGETTVGFLMMGHTLTGQSPTRAPSPNPTNMVTNPASPPFFSFRSLSTLHSNIAHVVVSRSHLSLPLHPHRKSPPSPTTPADTLACPSASPISHRVASHPSESAMRSARSLSSKQHPSTRTGHWPPPLRKNEMQHASLFANAARRTPYAHAHATPRRRRSLSRDFERERRTRQSRRNAAHCIFLHGSTVV